MGEKKPRWIIVLDQGSRAGPSVVEDESVRCLIIDHHLSDEFPESAQVSLKLAPTAKTNAAARWFPVVIVLLCQRRH